MVEKSTPTSTLPELMNRLLKIEMKVDGLQRGMTTLNGKVNSLAERQELALWFASGEDDRFRPRDGRRMSAAKELMINEALAKIKQSNARSQLSICHAIFRKFQNIPGAYIDINSFRRQVSRLA